MELLFRNFARFINLETVELDLIKSKFINKIAKRKEILIETGQSNVSVYFVVKGCLRSFYMDKDGLENVVSFAIEDWWISGGGFNKGDKAILSIDALEETQMLVIEQEALDVLYQKIPKLERYFRILMQNSLMTQMERIMHTNSFSAEQRYKAFSLKYPHFERRIPQKYLASYLGITPEFLSKMKGQILKSG